MSGGKKQAQLCCILSSLFISTVLNLWEASILTFFPLNITHYVFLYNFSGIDLHLNVLLSLIPRRSKILVVASRILPVQEAWPVLALPWLSRKTLVASKYDSLLWLKIVPGLQVEQHCPVASW